MEALPPPPPALPPPTLTFWQRLGRLLGLGTGYVGRLPQVCGLCKNILTLALPRRARTRPVEFLGRIESGLIEAQRAASAAEKEDF